jgi:uncharacterized alpha/beta hydrolase family protein
MKKINITLALIIPSILIAGSIITATNIVTKDKLQIAKSEAVQGCYEVTSGVKKLNSEDSLIEEIQINRETLEECLTLKGF